MGKTWKCLIAFVALAVAPHASGQQNAPVRAWGIVFNRDISEQEFRKQLADRKIDLVSVDDVRFSLRRGETTLGEVMFARGKIVLATQTWVVSSDAGAITFAHALLDAAKSASSRPGTDAEFGEQAQPDGSYRWANFLLAGTRISVTELDTIVDHRRVHLVQVDEHLF